MSTTVCDNVAAKPRALRDLPPFPPVAARLIRLVSEDEPCFGELADLIRSDAAFSAEMLRLANSPVCALRYEILDVPHAIAVLGLNRLNGLVMTVAMKDLLLLAGHHEALKRCWRHNLACALSAELLAEASWVDKGLGYTAGLLHDVGMLALAAVNPDPYTDLIKRDQYDVAEHRRRERELFEIDHCEAGRWLLEDWGLPAVFQQVAARHHDACREDDLEVTGLVRKSCQVADMAGFTVCGKAPPWDPEVPLGWLNEPARIRFKEQFEDLPITVATKINTFDCDFLL